MSRLGSVIFTAALFLATLIALGLLVLPIVAIFARVPLHLLIDQMRDPIVRDALMLTVTTNAIALAVILLVGTPAAYLLGTRRFRGREVVKTTSTPIHWKTSESRPMRPENAASSPMPATVGGRTSGSSTSVMMTSRPRNRRVPSR